MKGKVYKYSIFFYLHVFGTIGFGQQIDSIRYSPLFPDLNDQIEVVVFLRYSNYGCIKDSSHLVDMVGNQYLGSSYTCCIPGIDAIHYDTDTFLLNPNMIIQGYVDFYYMCGYKITSDCPAFPILVSGDTIPYPSDMAWLSIPVGYQLQIGKNADPISFEIFPNPTSGELKIKYLSEYSGGTIISFYSVDGRFVDSFSLTSMLETHSLDLSHFKSGYYLYKLEIDNEVMRTGKIIIQ